ncbi:hypothetical protein BCB68_10255 [Leptotrichia sp. oral taxon 498]|uniref:UvrD-helicase domain-containing protein n=1 Tax=Leptotrichia sp. oral taxon 498 TaxID=712368 RepID=UPI000B8CBF12|nr:UvrD-helicase domain-containing protein [Leptotrichia sp. oral taxon 498]ASQ49262.1 hypothetical protein BCB68_10255 [Leptotrichia sp. oral taxon 498]
MKNQESNKIILKASAGTGKTYRLSLEYIYNLLKNIDFKNIVVVTFTKKATAEIKERIFNFLYQVAFEKSKGIELKKNLKEIYNLSEDDFDKEKLQDIYFEMLKNKEDIRIYTIDSFTNRIFKQAIAPYFEISSFETLDSESNDFYEKIFKKIMDNENYYKKFEFLIEEVGEKKEIKNYVKIIEELVEFQKKYVIAKDFELKEEKKDNPKKVLEVFDFLTPLQEIYSEVKIFSEEKGKNISECFNDKLFEIFDQIKKESENSSEKKIEIVVKNLEKLLDSKIKNYYNGKFIRKKELTETLQELQKNFLDKFSKYILKNKVYPFHNKLKEFCEFLYDLVRREKISSKKFTHDDISIYTYEFIFDKNLKFIENNKFTQDFFEIIGGNIDTIMVDEFQDTSILQWKILKLIMDCAKNIICVGDEKQSIYGWRDGEKELFENLDEIVDGSKVETLKKSYRSYKAVIENVNKIYCDYDEKSNWNYEKVDYKAEDAEYQKGYFEFKINELESKKSPTEKRIFKNIIQMIENKEIKNLGKSCIIAGKNKYLSEIASELNAYNIPYTLKSNKSILEHSAVNPIYRLIKYFLYNNFQYLLEFLRSDLIGCLNSHVKYILENKNIIEIFMKNSKEEDFDLFLENFDFNFDFEKNKNENNENTKNINIERIEKREREKEKKEEIKDEKIEKKYEDKEEIEDKEKDKEIKIKKEELLKYKKINLIERNGFLFSDVLSKIKKLKKLSENLNSKTKKENFSLEVIKDFEITNFYSTNSDIKNIFEFFNILKSHTDLFDFINYIEEKKEDIKQFGSEDKNAINLMTVHKSKGLEFDTVFYYKCKRMSKNSRNETSKIKTFIQFDRNFEKVTEFLVTLKKYEKLILRDEKYKKIRELEEEKEKIEEINRDYVALTRAKKNLILLFDIKKSGEKYCDKLTEKLIEKYKDCLYLNESENYSNGEIYEEINEIKKIKNMKETTILDLKKILPYFSDNIAKNDRNSSKINLEKEFKRKKGLAMHYYFEHILTDVENEKKVANSAIFSRYGNMIGKNNIFEMIERMNNFIQRNLEIYNPKYKVYNEFEIYDNEKMEKRIIDRINIDEKNKKIYIFDYKTGYEPEKNEKYKEQIENYKRILSKKVGKSYEIITQILEV